MQRAVIHVEIAIIYYGHSYMQQYLLQLRGPADDKWERLEEMIRQADTDASKSCTLRVHTCVRSTYLGTYLSRYVRV